VPVGELDPDAWRQQRTSFGSVAAGYAAHRPGYPADAVTALVGERPRRVLDLGAGTGLLTGVLLAAGHEVVAVDPAAPMLVELRARHPQVVTHVGEAEAVPLPDGSVDAVVAGQAAHWFDPEPAAEQRRVLRPGGAVGLAWNTRDEQVPWVAALGRVLAEVARSHATDEDVVDAFARALGAPGRAPPLRHRAAGRPRAGGRRHRHPQLRRDDGRRPPGGVPGRGPERCSTPTPTPAAATSSTCRNARTRTG